MKIGNWACKTKDARSKDSRTVHCYSVLKCFLRPETTPRPVVEALRCGGMLPEAVAEGRRLALVFRDGACAAGRVDRCSVDCGRVLWRCGCVGGVESSR